MRLEDVKARTVYDSRGTQTIEVDLITDCGIFSSSVPSGASVGSYEAVYLPVEKAMNVLKTIKQKITGNYEDFKALDKKLISLDGTKNKSNLGANVILAISMAGVKADASFYGKEVFDYISEKVKTKPKMPRPYMNIINGGKHAGISGIQEFMIMPTGNNFSSIMTVATRIYQEIKNKLKQAGLSTLVGDEGGYVIKSKTTDILGFLTNVFDGDIAIDCASSEFYKNDLYFLDGKEYNSETLTEFYRELVSEYRIVSIEDGCSQDDWNGWKRLMNLGIQIVGDDLLATNPERIKKAIELKACNALLLKLNQIGTVTEALEAFKIAKQSEWNVIVSHRSGETEDCFISDLAVGLGVDCKFGAPARERNIKYNRLLRIEEML